MPRKYTKRINKKKGRKVLSSAQVKAVAKIAKKVDLRNDETKMIKRSSAGNYITQAAQYGLVYMVPLDYIQAGSGVNNRIGNKINVRGLDVKMEFTRTGPAAANDVYVRLSVVETTDPSVVAGTTSWVGGSITNYFTEGFMTMAKFNTSLTPSKFRVLSDKVIKLPLVQGSGYTSTPYHKYLKVGKDYSYDGTSTVKKIAILLSWYSPNPAVMAGTNALGYNNAIITYFKDA